MEKKQFSLYPKTQKSQGIVMAVIFVIVMLMFVGYSLKGKKLLANGTSSSENSEDDNDDGNSDG